MINVVLADDHRIFSQGLMALLKDISDFNVAAVAETGEQLLTILQEHPADVLVLDISLPDVSGLELIEPLLKQYPNMAIVMLSMHAEEDFIRSALNIGALGYVLKQSTHEELEQAIRKTHAGDYYYCNEVTKVVMRGISEPKNTQAHVDLTTREVEVLQCLAKGMTSKAIARYLNISTHTVKTHRGNLLDKLPVRNTAQMIRFAVENDLLDLE